MINTFDYVYYRIYSFYKYKWKEDMPNMYANGLLFLMQLINIASLLILFYSLLNTPNNIGKIEWAIFMLVLFLFNFLRHKYYVTFKQLELKWSSEKSDIRKTKGYSIILYLLFTISLFIIVVNYSDQIELFGQSLGL